MTAQEAMGGGGCLPSVRGTVLPRAAYEAAICASGLPATARLVALVLASKADSHAGARGGPLMLAQADIAGYAGVSLPTATRELARLEVRGWITRSRGGGRSNPTAYTFTVPRGGGHTA